VSKSLLVTGIVTNEISHLDEFRFMQEGCQTTKSL